MIKYKKDIDNIVTLTFDMEGRDTNIINQELGAALVPVLEHLKEEKEKAALRGVIITSAKKTFLSGGELDYLYHNDSAESVFNFSQSIQKLHRELERPGVPVVAAINGSALGGGFELALACHHRIVVDQASTRLGNPEAQLGMMPGGGGVIRLMWLLGIERAFPILAEGRQFNPSEALQAGLIDALAIDERTMMEQAKAWLLEHPDNCRSWDVDPKKAKPATDAARIIQKLTAQLSQGKFGNQSAPRAILNTMAQGSKVDFDTACRIESRYFTKLILGRECKNRMKAFWYDFNAIKQGAMRPKGVGKFRPRKVGIIGAGRMGSGIAVCCLQRGLEVVMKDVSKAIADKGKEKVKQQLQALVGQARISQEQYKKMLGRISSTENSAAFEDCDIVIEAVFEHEMVKAKVTREATEYMDAYTVFASNTISIPITKLAAHAKHPKNYVGLHFFAPVDRVPLVEIVKGQQSSEETIARAYDFVKFIRKTPVLVKDTWGFYVSRVQNTYILEGIQLLQEGYPPALIEKLGIQAGMPKGALEMADDISLSLVLRYENQAATHYGSKYIQHPAANVLSKMLDKLERPGRNKGAGFYEYTEEGGKGLWSGLTEHFPVTQKQYARELLIERFLFTQVIEAVWCLQEKIICSVPEANLGSILGWGFPGSKGGVIQFINDYGQERFVDQCRQYEASFGPRFKVPRLLREKVEKELL